MKAELEGQILDQSPSLAILLETARGLESRDWFDRQRSALQLVAGLLGASACALYVDDGQALRLQGSWPPGLSLSPDTLVPTSDSVVGEILVTQRVATVRDRIVAAEGRLVAGREPAMAGPLLDEYGDLFGVVVVEHLPLLKFTPNAVRTFDLLLRWISAALGRPQIESPVDAFVLERDLAAIVEIVSEPSGGSMAPLRLRAGPGATMVGREVIRGPGDEPQSGSALRRSTGRPRPTRRAAARGRRLPAR